jgi:molybdopterin-binding protein
MGSSGIEQSGPSFFVYSCRSADAPTPPGLLQFYQALAAVAAKRRFGYTGVRVRAFRLEKMELPMKISARNQLKGTIVDVVKGATTSHIRIDIGGGVIVTASITNEAVDELKLAKSKPATAVIKASDVMVGVD